MSVLGDQDVITILFIYAFDIEHRYFRKRHLWAPGGQNVQKMTTFECVKSGKITFFSIISACITPQTSLNSYTMFLWPLIARYTTMNIYVGPKSLILGKFRFGYTNHQNPSFVDFYEGIAFFYVFISLIAVKHFLQIVYRKLELSDMY